VSDPDETPTAGAIDHDPVVVVVRIPTPRFALRRFVHRRMRATTDLYGAVPGLRFKAYTVERASRDYGGVYSWTHRAAAAAWFDAAWFERVRRERGSEPWVRTFAAPRSIDNVPGGTPAADGAGHVVTVVEIPLPTWATDELLLAGFADAEPTYRTVPGLLRKSFVRSDHGTFGGVYLWRDQAAATAWFDTAWRERVRSRFGADGSIEWFDAPILLPSRLPEVARR
jgi:hypothetical protein